MTTAVLMALKKLIKERLNPLSVHLGKQTKGAVRIPILNIRMFKLHKPELSLTQQESVDALDVKIIEFKSTGNDLEDAQAISNLIKEFRKVVQKKREGAGYSSDTSNTLDVLKGLEDHTVRFIEELSQHFGELLLNKPYTLTPENIVYYHAAYYIGEGFFSDKGETFLPVVGKSDPVREQKLKCLVEHLETLSELIKPDSSFEHRKTRTIKVLKALSLAHDQIINSNAQTNQSYLPTANFMGVDVGAPLALFSPSAGRMGELLNQANAKIAEMNAADFKTELTTPTSEPQQVDDDKPDQCDSPPPPPEDDGQEVNGAATSEALEPAESQSGPG